MLILPLLICCWKHTYGFVTARVIIFKQKSCPEKYSLKVYGVHAHIYLSISDISKGLLAT